MNEFDSGREAVVFYRNITRAVTLSFGLLFSLSLWADETPSPYDVAPPPVNPEDVPDPLYSESVPIIWYSSPNFVFKSRGYVQIDEVINTPTTPLLTFDGKPRGADVGFIFQFYQDWAFSAEVNTTKEARNNKSGWKNLNFSYSGLQDWQFVLGQVGTVYGLDNNNSLNSNPFMEVAMPEWGFTPPYVLGGSVFYVHDPVTVSTQVFVPRIQVQAQDKIVGRTPVGGITSISYSPIHRDTHAVHTSFSLWVQETDGSKLTEFNTIPEIYFPVSMALIDTGTIDNSDVFSVWDGALGYVYGPWSFQAEYVESWVNRSGAPNVAFDGYYGFVSYFFTGESRKYDLGSAGFIGITPIRHRYGAWEGAIRYSDMNLNDGPYQGGHEYDISFGLTWYPVKYLEFQTNYVLAMAEPTQTNQDQVINIFAGRFELIF